jgi:hypothetical protein
MALASPLLAVSAEKADAQTAMQRRAERPLVPRSHGRRQADRQAAQAQAAQVYVPGHWAWDRRRGQYSWVAGRWERYDPKHAFVGAGWHFRNGQWTFGPAR